MNHLTKSEEQKRRWENPEYRRKMSEAHKGYKMPESQKKKLSKALKGKLPKNFYEMQKLAWKVPKDNEKNPQWKGNEVSYVGLHQWVVRHLGQPDTCEHCGKAGLKGRFIQWANKSHQYKRELSDWIRLCVKCHKKYDKQNGNKRYKNRFTKARL